MTDENFENFYDAPFWDCILCGERNYFYGMWDLRICAYCGGGE